jgi:hypothetical protein
MTDNKLTDEQKTHVVQRLARYESSASIARWLRQECGVAISRQGVEYYDPDSYAGRHCAGRWKELFLATRKAITDDIAEIGAANQMVRVRWLDAMARAAMDKGSFKLAADLLAQVAREMREAGNTHEHKAPQEHDYTNLTDAELDRRLADVAAEAAAMLGFALAPLAAADAGKSVGDEGEAREPQQAQDAV